MKLRTQHRLSEFLFKFLFSGPTLFVVGFSVGIFYEHNFPGFIRDFAKLGEPVLKIIQGLL